MNRSFFPIFQLVFLLTAFLFGGLTFALLQLQWHGAVILGVVCGTVFGIGIGYFVRNMEMTVAIDPDTNLTRRLQVVLLDMGYRLEHEFAKVMTFRPTFRAGLLADRIRVELSPGETKFIGPKYHLELLKERIGS